MNGSSSSKVSSPSGAASSAANHSKGSISPFGMVLQSIGFYRTTTFLLGLGVAAATAVIVGALLVGDSVRGSLHGLVVDRLARIEQFLITPRFITHEAAKRMGSSKDYPSSFAPPVAAIVFPKSTAEHATDHQEHRAGSILVMAIDDDFWTMSDSKDGMETPPSLRGRQIVLNQELASELHASVGDDVTIRLPVEQAVPSDSPLGRRDDLTQSLARLKVVAIVPNRGLGQFDLRTSQNPSRNAWVPLKLVQDTLDRPGEINAIFVARKENARPSQARDLVQAKNLAQTLLTTMEPSFEDLGLKVERITRKFPSEKDPNQEETIYDYYHITSDQLLVPPEYVDAIQKTLGDEKCQRVLTYLANEIRKGKQETPINATSSQEAPSQDASTAKKKDNDFATYSTVSAIDPGATFSFAGLVDGQARPLAPLNEKEVVINQWLADRLKLAIGDPIHMTYFLPENSHGKEVQTDWDGTVVAIAPLTQPTTKWQEDRPPKFEKAPTLFNDNHLTPEVPGITNQDSIEKWDLPFSLKLDPTIEDDQYWNQHRLTPKVYMSLAEGQRLFGSRFGSVSSLRVSPTSAASEQELMEKLLPSLRSAAAKVGLLPIPLRAQQLAAAAGTTPFDALFLSLSFFVIVAALILVSLLFRLGVEQRADQWGLLLSLGWQRRQVRRLLLSEGLLVSILGAAFGVVLGIGYARGMIWGLSGWWVGAVSVPFLTFQWTTFSLLLGYLLGILTACLTVYFATGALKHVSALQLLRGKFESAKTGLRKGLGGRMLHGISVGCALLALALFPVGWSLSGEEQAGAYLGSGMLLLMAAVAQYYLYLRKIGSSDADGKELTFQGMAAQSGRRSPLRSSLAMGLIAVSSFLVLAISLFQAKPTESASGGYAILAESSQPLPSDLGEDVFQREVLGEKKQSELAKVHIESIRLRPGDDASCNNLYQAQQPRVLGISKSMAEHDAAQSPQKRFPWAGHAKPENDAERASNFSLLDRVGDGSLENPFPVVLDMNTAMWSLHKGVGIGEVFSFEFDGKVIYFKTIGLLKNSLLQGYLVLGEANFVKAFPQISGFQFFLADVGDQPKEKVTELLEGGWGDEGLDAVDSASVLQRLLGVQNTYLSAFQALGGLGLLLGTFGLAVAQTRSVVERRSEIALLRALGFSRSRVSQLLMSENAWLLLLGVVTGGGCALIAIFPAWLGGQSITDSLWPFGMLLIIVVCGLLSGTLAIFRANRLPILESLRGK